MNRLLTLLVALVALSVAGAAFAADGIKLASVDFRKIAQESKAGVEATKEISKLAGTLEKSLKEKEAELDKMKDTLEGKGKKLTAKERAAKEKEFKKKLDTYREAAKDAQKELQTKEDEYGTKLMGEVDRLIKEFAPKNGYSMVIRKGDAIYTDGKLETTDITADIIKILDAPPQTEPPKK